MLEGSEGEVAVGAVEELVGLQTELCYFQVRFEEVRYFEIEKDSEDLIPESNLNTVMVRSVDNQIQA